MKRSDFRIVVVDDNVDAATGLAALLEWGDFSVVGTVFNPEQALDCILKERPHVALLDIAMPSIDGYELAGSIRSEVNWPIRLVAVTGLGLTCDKIDAAEAGFHAHLVKPVGWRDLELLLAGYLDDFDSLPPVRKPK
jgi:CheY-like chemotaxis protein